MQSLGFEQTECTGWSADFGSCLEFGFVLLFFIVLFAIAAIISVLVLKKAGSLSNIRLKKRLADALDRYQRASRPED